MTEEDSGPKGISGGRDALNCVEPEDSGDEVLPIVTPCDLWDVIGVREKEGAVNGEEDCDVSDGRASVEDPEEMNIGRRIDGLGDCAVTAGDVRVEIVCLVETTGSSK